MPMMVMLLALVWAAPAAAQQGYSCAQLRALKAQYAGVVVPPEHRAEKARAERWYRANCVAKKEKKTKVEIVKP
jgi:hypothetical protein